MSPFGIPAVQEMHPMCSTDLSETWARIIANFAPCKWADLVIAFLGELSTTIGQAHIFNVWP